MNLGEDVVTRLEALAHTTRAAVNASHGSVNAGLSKEVHDGFAAMVAVMAPVIGQKPAEAAVTQWLLVDRPIGDVAWFQRLTPGTRVHVPGSHVYRSAGTVEAPRDVDEDRLRSSDHVLLKVWVQWDGGPRDLAFSAALEVCDDTAP